MPRAHQTGAFRLGAALFHKHTGEELPIQRNEFEKRTAIEKVNEKQIWLRLDEIRADDGCHSLLTAYTSKSGAEEGDDHSLMFSLRISPRSDDAFYHVQGHCLTFSPSDGRKLPFDVGAYAQSFDRIILEDAAVTWERMKAA